MKWPLIDSSSPIGPREALSLYWSLIWYWLNRLIGREVYPTITSISREKEEDT